MEQKIINVRTKLTKQNQSVVREDNKISIYSREGVRISDAVYPSVGEAKHAMNAIK